MAQKASDSGNPQAKPFVKWAGGKRSLLLQMRLHYPEQYGRYFEPFVGGGAVFFDLAPKRAVLRDINSELITTFAVIRDKDAGLVEALEEHAKLHEHDLARIRAGGEAVGGTHENYPYYYQVRALDPAELSDVEIAARFIYLNRTCFNGLYRVNASGKFNVPAGRYRKPAIADAANLRACEHALADTDVGVGDFASINPSPKDFVYFDPPYDPMPTEGQNESFTGYTSGGFDAADQARLRDYAVELTQQGVFVILSNHDTPRVRRLYEEESDVFEVHQIMASRAINSDAAGRGKVAEVLISNVAAVLA